MQFLKYVINMNCQKEIEAQVTSVTPESIAKGSDNTSR
jgi:hypothetical protein